VKRTQVITKIKQAAKRHGVRFEQVELKKHTGIIVDGHRSTISRQTEIPDGTARAFWKQFEEVLGEGWWR